METSIRLNLCSGHLSHPITRFYRGETLRDFDGDGWGLRGAGCQISSGYCFKQWCCFGSCLKIFLEPSRRRNPKNTDLVLK